ncbi:hypothetical protein RclHR1_06200020 [Rhizophagus clarus]|uniref:Uncharacterized protein n=1 Tax=Rhizophagus clarus TaxID=94130 RepID=A0A2Z6S3H0_9GLOM|nr:hypothetical protein RclHR1_06200020 [Rhizophagus clarus]
MIPDPAPKCTKVSLESQTRSPIIRFNCVFIRRPAKDSSQFSSTNNKPEEKNKKNYNKKDKNTGTFPQRSYLNY